MRILMLNHNVRGKSTYFRCIHFARQLVKRGHAVTLLTISPTARRGFKTSAVEGVAVVETPDLLSGRLRSGWDAWDTLQRVLFLNGRHFDLVHAFDSRPNVVLPALVYQARTHVPLIMDWADWWGRGGVIADRDAGVLNTLFAPVETFFEEGFRHRADGWTVISRALFQRSVDLGLPGDRILHLPSGADVESIRPQPREAARQALGLALDRPLLVFVGFVHYDIEFLVRAVARVAQTVPNVTFMTVGSRSDQVDQVAAQAGIASQVRQVGPKPYEALPQYLGAADVLLLPLTDTVANRGRWPNKLGDYMAAGRPIVTNPTGDIGDVFRQDAIGLLADDSVEDFAAKIVHLLQNPAEAEQLGANARRVAETKYSWEGLTPRLEAYYQQALERRSGRGILS